MASRKAGLTLNFQKRAAVENSRKDRSKCLVEFNTRKNVEEPKNQQIIASV